ncbi:MAG: 2Fe-2S iron-sulfur cluster binding domain-containing protein [Kiritimatiellaeota bacterium]|nr:2Fe-2S iron-sulfur cluster binding domain-containing protein [Kiritimatiellota bacterium]
MTFVLAVGTLCLICGVLAGLLTLAGRFLNDYGRCRVLINGGEREFEVDGGDSLLNLLTQEGLFIPSACGGRGSCGLCKVNVLSGGGPLLPTEGPHLAAEEIDAGMRLACQLKVRNDIEIEVPRELFSVQRYRAAVASIEDLTGDIKRLRLELVDPETIVFAPGQYIQLQAPAYGENPEAVYRAYSIASDRRDSRHIDLIIRLVPNGTCTTWVFTILKTADSVEFNGPYGEFCLRQSDRPMVFIAGGSGLAPFMSILAQMAAEQNARTCRFFFGARSRGDLFLLDDMARFERELPDFKFIPALSDPAPEDDWSGETGLITDVVARHFPDCSGMEAYLCGSPGMLGACIKVLSEHGLAEENIYFDKFA